MMTTEKELREALIIAAKAIEIANDWNLPSVQVHPPKKWNLDGGGEDASDGWCCTYSLSKKLRELASAESTET